MGGTNKRIFYKDPNFQDALIRFDFQFNGATDIRLITGSNGSYKTELHIQKDNFLIQTAQYKKERWFPTRHGECTFEFKEGKWYTMTIEFIGEQVIAHLDHKHMIYAKHPTIRNLRTDLAFQVDQAGASFDNLQVFQVGQHPEQNNNLDLIKVNEARNSNLLNLRKTLDEQ
jgi:hypothetical protein